VAGASKSGSHRAFAASFQGQAQGVERDDTKLTDSLRKKYKNCLYGEQHQFKDCLYLVEVKQQKGWVSDKEVEKLIEEKIKASSKLQTIINKIRGGGIKKKNDDEEPEAVEKAQLLLLVHAMSRI
jgi:hypothetical protein